MVNSYNSTTKKWITIPFSNYVETDPQKPYCLQTGWKSHTIRVPNSNSLIDINGDCKADLFIESIDKNKNVFYEFWIKDKDTGLFCLIQNEKVSSNWLTAVFMEVNDDEGQDMLIMDKLLNLHIYRNKNYGSKLCNKYFITPPFETMDKETNSKFFSKEKVNWWRITSLNASVNTSSKIKPTIYSFSDD